MRECWAEPLGNCRGGISGEHVVSKCLFPSGSVEVRGLEWCSKESKTIGLNSLTRNILCEGHNCDLSSLDTAALSTFNSFDEAIKLREFRGKYHRTKWTLRTFVVDGRLLERWFLKTLINISLEKEWIIGTGEHEPGKPSLELVEIAFGRRSFSGNEGLHVSVFEGYKADLRQGLSFTPLTESRNLVAGRFYFAGLRFLLSLYPEPFHYDGASRLMRHLRTVRFGMTESRALSKQSHRIRFRW